MVFGHATDAGTGITARPPAPVGDRPFFRGYANAASAARMVLGLHRKCPNNNRNGTPKMTKPLSIKPLGFSPCFSADVVPWVRLMGAAAPMSVGAVDATEAEVAWEAEFGNLLPDSAKGKVGK